MLLTVAPPAERATYIGFLNTILGVVIFVPVLGGLLADLLGFEALFVLSLALAGFAMIASWKMSSIRPAGGRGVRGYSPAGGMSEAGGGCPPDFPTIVYIRRRNEN
jgi:MFS family permease